MPGIGALFHDGIYTRMRKGICQVNWAAWEIVISFHNRELCWVKSRKARHTVFIKKEYVKCVNCMHRACEEHTTAYTPINVGAWAKRSFVYACGCMYANTYCMYAYMYVCLCMRLTARLMSFRTSAAQVIWMYTVEWAQTQQCRGEMGKETECANPLGRFRLFIMISLDAHTHPRDKHTVHA